MTVVAVRPIARPGIRPSVAIAAKKERIKQQIYKNRDLATVDVADGIDTFYNWTRRHSYLGGLSPEQFEAAHKPRRRSLH